MQGAMVTRLRPSMNIEYPPPPPPPSAHKQESRHKVPKSVVRAVLGRMQLTLHATRRTPHGASKRLVQAMFAWLVKSRRPPSRHCRNARVYGHTFTPIPLECPTVLLTAVGFLGLASTDAANYNLPGPLYLMPGRCMRPRKFLTLRRAGGDPRARSLGLRRVTRP